MFDASAEVPMRTDESLTKSRDRILGIARSHGARSIRVFGSRARAEAKPDSDLDLLVQLEDGRSLLDIVAMKQDLEDLLGCRVDVVTEASVSPYLRSEIIAHSVPL
jgi:predicted nucleotidyltransferase